MKLQEKANVALSLVAIVGAVVLFGMGRVEAGGALLAFLGGHLLPSPVPPPKDDGAE